jgi:hypothetical protein
MKKAKSLRGDHLLLADDCQAAKFEGMRRSEEYAQRLGNSHREYQKVRSAVSEQFENNLSNFLLVILKREAWGFAGIAAGQPEFKHPALANVFLIGVKGQLWLPGLTKNHVEQLDASEFS